MEELDTVRLVPPYVDKSKSPRYISTMIENNVKKLLSSLGIRNAIYPDNLRISKTKETKNVDQLELFFR
ncbi:MAG TPA: hypothetical protein DHW42_01115 [Candidatus Marinimicrobia bacterium]|nr:hypothetical protein [Candidatus Neomarinimicrobiota bacterium]